MYTILRFTVSVSCGGERLFPDCSYCPKLSNTAESHGCSGNCKFDLEKRICKKKGN